MDVSRFTTSLEPAPRVVFAQLAERGDVPRFYVRDGQAWQPITWNAFADEIRALALVLAEGGLERGEAVAIFAHNSVHWGAAALAIQAAGGVMVPIYPSSTPAQAAYILEHCEARFVFADTADRELGTNVERRFVLGDRDLLATGVALHAAAPDRFADLLDRLTLDDVGLMLYTSGTSGNPKGVPLTYANVAHNGRDWLESNAPLLEEGDVDLLWLPMSHIFGFGEMCQGNVLGWTTYLSNPRDVIEDLIEVRPTVFFAVPAYWEKLAAATGTGSHSDRLTKLAEVSGGRIRFALSGGAGLGREVKDLFAGAGLVIIEGYGLTECSPTLTLNRPYEFRFDSVGKPLASVELRLADDGEILARGPNVFAGYHKDPDATREAFTDDGWFKTGDLGRFTDDGFLQIIGRKKEILVTAGGKNVPPANIEMRFADDPVIEHLVVYGDGKKYLVAGVWTRAGLAGAERDQYIERRIREVNDNLARCETIKKWTVIDQPLTPENGLVTASLKLRRKHIYEAFHDQFEALYA